MNSQNKDPDFQIHKIEDYQQFIQENRSFFSAGTILLLSGQVGAGKTEFVKAIVDVLHQKQNAKSPTFALHHHYHGEPNIEHWDLYRLQSEDDLESSGFWDQFHDQNSLIIVEWPQRLKQEWLPQNWQVHHLQILLQDDNKRLIKKLSKSAVVAE